MVAAVCAASIVAFHPLVAVLLEGPSPKLRILLRSGKVDVKHILAPASEIMVQRSKSASGIFFPTSCPHALVLNAEGWMML